ncbi:putative 3-hydroxyisobutyrate dehydrogenase, mitochondrial [Colletotrichum tanaceti]|uniref:3-hydroxyisobutyrate dehydrogenase n=1 Tax=Colletotrichum tanaceti TaxID=1306861 RepID=A0A4U6XU84_9PEZI|nr:putative 3-hydroxyisobutyrate dehydrogenase, mitochondrial [Colletotrichum tanaceti]TKW59573.1 putative 3-hydroxyisobutyrate dehydrogenase, mitochondrial [Colletotrichum tanaceti]
MHLACPVLPPRCFLSRIPSILAIIIVFIHQSPLDIVRPIGFVGLASNKKIIQKKMRTPTTLRTFRVVQRRGFATTPRRLESYGFIGLGQMGYQMAKNLRAKLSPADEIRIFDINKTAVANLAKEMGQSQVSGAKVAVVETARDAAIEADTVITVLPEPSHVKAVYASILADLPARERIFIDCSTIDPSSSREVAASVAAAAPRSSSGRQSVFVDAPMSGGVVGATAGTLTFMLGCDAGRLPAVEPTLLRMGRRVLHCGPQGTGLSAKLANNYLLAVNNIATAEAMNLGMRWGLDPKVLAGVINVSTGRCWPSEVNNPVAGVVEGSPAGRDYNGGFGIGLMRKDLGLAVVAAQEAGARLELAGKATEVYAAAEAEESCKGRDFSVVYRYLGGKE